MNISIEAMKPVDYEEFIYTNRAQIEQDPLGYMLVVPRDDCTPRDARMRATPCPLPPDAPPPALSLRPVPAHPETRAGDARAAGPCGSSTRSGRARLARRDRGPRGPRSRVGSLGAGP